MASLKYLVATEHTNDHGQIIGMTGGWFSTLARVKNVLCEDGKRRTAYVTTQEPSTYWTIEARINIGKKSVRGYLHCTDEGEYLFHAYEKN